MRCSPASDKRWRQRRRPDRPRGLPDDAHADLPASAAQVEMCHSSKSRKRIERGSSKFPDPQLRGEHWNHVDAEDRAKLVLRSCLCKPHNHEVFLQFPTSMFRPGMPPICVGRGIQNKGSDRDGDLAGDVGVVGRGLDTWPTRGLSSTRTVGGIFATAAVTVQLAYLATRPWHTQHASHASCGRLRLAVSANGSR